MKELFGRYQKILLFFGSLIYPNLYSVYPNGYSRKNSDGSITAIFYLHDRIARRCYRAFKPVWYILHFWDWLSSPVPEWNLGFDELTKFSVAGANSPCDGQVAYSFGASEGSFSSVRGQGSGTSANVTASTAVANLISLNGGSATNFQAMTRAYVNFDVSGIGDGGVVTAAVLTLRGSSGANGLGSANYNITKSTAAGSNTLVVGDYSKFEDTVFATVTYADWNPASNNVITLNAAGRTAIQDKVTGVVQFCGRLSWDVANSYTGTWANNTNSAFGFSSADSAFDPKLVVTYLPLITGTLDVTLDAVTLSANDTFLGWGTVYQWQVEDWVRIRTHTQLEDRLTEQMFIDWTNWAVQSLVPKLGRNKFYITTSSLGVGTSFSLSSLKMRGIEKVVDATNGLVLPDEPQDFELDLPSIYTNSAFWVQEGETLRIAYGDNLTGGSVTLYYYRVPTLIDSRNDVLDIENSYVSHVLEYCVNQVEEWKRGSSAIN